MDLLTLAVTGVASFVEVHGEEALRHKVAEERDGALLSALDIVWVRFADGTEYVDATASLSSCISAARASSKGLLPPPPKPDPRDLPLDPAAAARDDEEDSRCSCASSLAAGQHYLLCPAYVPGSGIYDPPWPEATPEEVRETLLTERLDPVDEDAWGERWRRPMAAPELDPDARSCRVCGTPMGAAFETTKNGVCAECRADRAHWMASYGIPMFKRLLPQLANAIGPRRSSGRAAA